METEASFKIPTASVEPLAEPGSVIQETALKPLVQTVTYRGVVGWNSAQFFLEIFGLMFSSVLKVNWG